MEDITLLGSIYLMIIVFPLFPLIEQFFFYWIQITFIGLLVIWLGYSIKYKYFWKRFIYGSFTVGLLYICAMTIYSFFIFDNDTFFVLLEVVTIFGSCLAGVVSIFVSILVWLYKIIKRKYVMKKGDGE